jgi:hypothetical protein
MSTRNLQMRAYGEKVFAGVIRLKSSRRAHPELGWALIRDQIGEGTPP